jgi:molecular chaperone IbpA
MTTIQGFIPETFYNSIVGFDHFFDELDHFYSKVPKTNHPPSNIVRMDENNYIIQVSVSGFNPEDLEVVIEENVLRVSGKMNESSKIPKEKYLYRGISGRNFSRYFRLHDYMQINQVDLVNGILNVHLEYVLPEEKRPRKIPIQLNVDSLKLTNQESEQVDT